jgi:hypothetical protein
VGSPCTSYFAVNDCCGYNYPSYFPRSFCNSSNVCQECLDVNQPCDGSIPCCPGLTCGAQGCQ